jgi:hypothetical protein
VTFFGIANYDGCLACDAPNCDCEGTPSPTPAFDEQGRRIFQKISGRFAIVIEARPGSGGFPVNMSSKLHPLDPSVRPDLQIENTMPMGANPDPTVDCDTAVPPGLWGGIAAVVPPGFGPDPGITSALRDFACRFFALSPSTPYTLDANGAEALANPGANPTVQFVDKVALSAAFPFGDSLLTVQIQDQPPAGFPPHIGPTAQIIVRVVTPTPLTLR